MIETDLGIEGLTDPELIGEGGFAAVYAATDERLHRRVAVKIMRKNLSSSAQRRFARECAVMGRLSGHPNVATVHSAGYTDDGMPYLVMELLTGGSLSQKVKQSGPLPWRDALRYVIPVADALQAAHAAGVLHRDIKPDNILLDGDEPHLTDFGIAQLQWVDSHTTGDVVASWHHSPPETLDDRRDERSDVYSLASTLYTLIAGHGPFSDPENPAFLSLVHRMASEPPPELPADLCPPAFNPFFQRALAKDPDDRPQTAADLGVELRQLAAISDDGVRSPAASPGPAPASGPRPTGLLWSALAIVVAVAVVGGLTWLARDEDLVSTAGSEVTAGSAAAPDGSDAAALGSAVNPYPFGQSVNLSYDDLDTAAERQWRVELVEPMADLTDQGTAEPPSSHERLASARVRLTYVRGREPGPVAHFRFRAVGSSGTVFEPAAEPCGAAADRLDLGAGLAVAGAIEGRVCWWVPGDELASLRVTVEALPADGQIHLAGR